MHRSRIGICFALLIALVAMASLPALADETKSIDEQYLALATQRTKAEVACDKAAKAMDARENGWNDVNQAIADVHGKIADTFNKAIRAESAKPEGDRNQNLVEELNGQLHELETDWQAFSRDREKANAIRTRLTQQINNEHNIFEGLTNQERLWKDGSMDLAVLGSAYDAVTRAVDSNCTKSQQLVDDMKTKQKDWEAKLAAATKAVGPEK